MVVLRVAVGHLRHSLPAHTGKSAAHTITANHTAATRRVASSGAVVGGLVDTDRSTIKPRKPMC